MYILSAAMQFPSVNMRPLFHLFDNYKTKGKTIKFPILALNY